jgi:hypothetical protein
MIRKLLLVVALALTIVGLTVAVSTTAYADSPTAGTNSATIDITIHDSGHWSIGGVELSAMNIMPMDSTAVAYARTLDSVHLMVEGEAVQLDIQGTPLVKLQWSPSSRAAVAKIASQYGVVLTPDIQARIEEWISTSSIDFTARYSNETSRPLNISLSTPILVDLYPNGAMAIEKAPLALAIDPIAYPWINAAGYQATLCWNKGTFTAKIDGQDLPSITVDPSGFQLINRAFSLGIATDLTSLFGSTFGVDVSLNGAPHPAGASCGG